MALIHTTCKQLLRYTFLLSIVFLGASSAQAARSNILLLIADDFGIDVASFYPVGPRRQTTPPPPPMPNLAALAQQGVIFTRVWASPWCSPTRAQILTGRYNFRTGIGRANTSDMPPLSMSEVILPEVFTAAFGSAYLTANLGKWHLSSNEIDPINHGWRHYAGGHPDLGHLPSYFNWPKIVDGVTSISTVYATTDTADETLSTIARARAEGKRYFAWTAFNAPHDPFHVPPAGLHPTTPLPPAGATNRAKFAAMVEAMDTEIGRLLKAVSLTDTTVIFIGDNGTAGSVVAQPYPRAKAKGTMYEGGVRVPLIVAGAGVASPNRKVTALVSVVDQFPTILALAGVDPAGVPRNDGVSLMPYLRRQTHPSPRTWLYAEQFTKTFDTAWQRAARDGRFKLVKRNDGSREFYDLSSDSSETKNLLNGSLTSDQGTALERLDRRMARLLATRGT
jgi:arylsulfatase A-like enzyme